MTHEFPTFPLDHLALMGREDATALIIRGQSYSFGELNLCTGRLAAYLAAAGLKQGDRVATWAAKGEISCLMPLAAARVGMVHVPINPVLKGPQARHIMADSGAMMLITNAARAAQLAGDAGDYKIVDEGELAQILSDEMIRALPPSEEGFDHDRLAAILYTSGSTGLPKGVMLSHANLTLGAQSVAQYLKLSSDDRVLAVLPLSFDYGQNQLFSAWAAGAAAIPLDYLLPRDVVRACAQYRITTIAAVPPLWVQLVEQDWTVDAVKSLRRLTNSGGALTPPLVEHLRAVFGAVDIYAMYGLTEAFRSTFLDPDLIDRYPTSMGRAIPYAEIMVVRADGAAAGPGEEGELVHAGPLVAQGYWRDLERTYKRFRAAPSFSKYGGTAVYSGDMVRRDENDLLYFVGRDDAMIKTSGNRISPTEIEQVAMESGMVVEACAIGRADDRLGQAIILFVRARSGGGEDDLQRYLKQALPNFMQPAEIIWLNEFPKGANGKLDRNILTERMKT